MSDAVKSHRPRADSHENIRARDPEGAILWDEEGNDTDSGDRPARRNGSGTRDVGTSEGRKRQSGRASLEPETHVPTAWPFGDRKRSPCPEHSLTPISSKKGGESAHPRQPRQGSESAPAPTTRKLERRSLRDLVSHPAQDRHFDNLPEPALRALAEDIRARGLQTRIEILPANCAGLRENTILKGHQRKRALELLGETECQVVVRYDLAGADAATIELEFLDDNANRRQLCKLSMARIALRRYELSHHGPANRRRREGEVREIIGNTVGMSGRNLDRYLSILRLPAAVQRAFEGGLLPLATAARIATLEQPRTDGLSPGEVVKGVFAPHERRLPERTTASPASKSLGAVLAELGAVAEGLRAC